MYIFFRLSKTCLVNDREVSKYLLQTTSSSSLMSHRHADRTQCWSFRKRTDWSIKESGCNLWNTDETLAVLLSKTGGKKKTDLCTRCMGEGSTYSVTLLITHRSDVTWKNFGNYPSHLAEQKDWEWIYVFDSFHTYVEVSSYQDACNEILIKYCFNETYNVQFPYNNINMLLIYIYIYFSSLELVFLSCIFTLIYCNVSHWTFQASDSPYLIGIISCIIQYINITI